MKIFWQIVFSFKSKKGYSYEYQSSQIFDTEERAREMADIMGKDLMNDTDDSFTVLSINPLRYYGED